MLNDTYAPFDAAELIAAPTATTSPDDAAARIERARSLVRECVPVLGTPGAVYLTARGIDVAALPKGVVGWHPPTASVVYVARDVRDAVTACQRVSVGPDGKALVDERGRKVKRTNGVLRGAAMALPGDGPVALACDGPEDALSLWQATGKPVRCPFGQAVGDAPFPAGATVTIVADNDPPDCPTHASVAKAAARLSERGLTALACRPPEGLKDANDLLIAKGPEAIRAMVAAAAPVDADAWPAPDMSVVAEGRRPPPPLPVAVFGPWSGWINDTAEATSSPPDYAATALLVVAASLIGNARWVSPWAGWTEPSCLWVGLIGDPSSGKSPAMTPLLGAMRSIEASLAAGYDETRRQWLTDKERAACVCAAWETDVKSATKDGTPPPIMPAAAEAPDEPARPRLVMGDATGEALAAALAGQPKGLLMVRDELAGWLAGFDRYSGGGSERAFWLEAFGGRPFTIDRVKHGGKPVVIRHLTVSVLGGIQPDRLSSLLHSGDDDGLSARLLVTWPDPKPPRRPTRTADNASAAAALRRLQSLEMAVDEHGAPVPLVVPLAPDAADLFDEWRRENHAATQAATGRLAGHMGKLPGLVLRLALALEHLWWSWNSDAAPPSTVSLKAVAGAATLASDYFVLMAERAYGDAALPEAERLAATLGRWIVKTRPAAINARDVRRKAGLPGLRDAAAVKVAIEALSEAGWLRPTPSREGDAAGRQKSDYSINPKLWG